MCVCVCVCVCVCYPFACNVCNNHPLFTSRQICVTLENGSPAWDSIGSAVWNVLFLLHCFVCAVFGTLFWICAVFGWAVFATLFSLYAVLADLFCRDTAPNNIHRLLIIIIIIINRLAAVCFVRYSASAESRLQSRGRVTEHDTCNVERVRIWL
jgi:hypothetical protein